MHGLDRAVGRPGSDHFGKQGTQTVYGWIRDNEGNVSEMISDDIGFDRAPWGWSGDGGAGQRRHPAQLDRLHRDRVGPRQYQVVYTDKTCRSVVGVRLRQGSTSPR